MGHTTRALQLLMRAIAEVEDFEELERLRGTCWELYAGEDQTFQELERAIKTRTNELTEQMTQGPGARDSFEVGGRERYVRP